MVQYEPLNDKNPDGTLRKIPEIIVPLPLERAKTLVEEATANRTPDTMLGHFSNFLTGSMFLASEIRYSIVDASHTRVQLDVDGPSIMGIARKGDIHRFFTQIQDALDKRERWLSKPIVVKKPEAQ